MYDGLCLHAVIRLPFSLDLALNFDQAPGPGITDPTLRGLTAVGANMTLLR